MLCCVVLCCVAFIHVLNFKICASFVPSPNQFVPCPKQFVPSPIQFALGNTFQMSAIRLYSIVFQLYILMLSRMNSSLQNISRRALKTERRVQFQVSTRLVRVAQHGSREVCHRALPYSAGSILPQSFITLPAVSCHSAP